MTTTPTLAEQQAALVRIRTLPRCANWPADLTQARADSVRSRLIDIEAVRFRRPPAPTPHPATRRREWTPPAGLPLFDIKRAASGERDD